MYRPSLFEKLVIGEGAFFWFASVLRLCMQYVACPSATPEDALLHIAVPIDFYRYPTIE